MRDAALLVVGHGAAEGLFRHLLVRHGLDHIRAGHEHVARVAHHHGEVGNRGRVDGAAGARAHHRRNLRNHARGEGVAQKDVGIAGKRQHTLLNARTARIVQANDRRTHLHRKVHDLHDFGGVGFRQRSAEDGEVLRKRVDRPAVDAAVARDDAIARDELIGHPEVEASVCDEFVDLFEGAGVEQQVDALARGQLACRALAPQALFPAAQLGAALELLERALGIRHAPPGPFPNLSGNFPGRCRSAGA